MIKNSYSLKSSNKYVLPSVAGKIKLGALSPIFNVNEIKTLSCYINVEYKIY